MSARILELTRCKHCKAELPRPTPRVCPICGGSLQRRYLALGCLTSAPPPVLLLALVALYAWRSPRDEPAEPRREDVRAAAQHARGSHDGRDPSVVRPAGTRALRTRIAR